MIDIDGAARVLAANGYQATALCLQQMAAVIAQQKARIAELEAQLAATLATIEAATCDGALYADGCKP